MNTQGGIGIWLVLAIGDGVDKVLDGYRVKLVPDETHLVILGVYVTSIVRNVPAAGKMLGETGDVAAISIHEPEVTVGLQQGGSELCARIYRLSFRIVGVHVLHVAVAARGEGCGNAAAYRTGSEYVLDIFCNHDSFLLLEFKIDI